MVSSLIGQKLGKYEIVQLIGRGGMATVYKGYHREIDRYCAIKVLPPHPGRDPRYVQRFRQEARAIARLQHPNILTLYDYGSEDDILYLATAYAPGGSLNDLIRPSGLSVLRTEQILSEIAAALTYAHSKGVIHRDIKPGNILMDGEGHTLLADFGIAKLREDNISLTEPGGVVGTPAYMSPEQSKGGALDPRIDIYSLGIVVYELLTGAPPFQGVQSLDVILQHITRPVPNINHARADLPPGIEGVMQMALAKQPDERYQTPLDFSQAFSRAIHGSMYDVQSDTSIPIVDDTVDSSASASPQPTRVLSEQITSALPATPGLYTFLFADIEDSTQLWEHQPEAMSLALTYYDMVMSEAVEIHQGKIFKTGGESIHAVFESAENAVEAALEIQRALHRAATRPEAPLLALGVQMGIYSGEAEKRANEFFGVALNRAARLMKAASGGQVLLSSTTKDLLPANTELRDLGMHRLRDVNEPEHIFQAVTANIAVNAAPIHSLTPRPTNLPAQLTSLIGREQNVADIGRLLRQPNLRLLSLLGPGGIGKTRLSIEVGNSLLDEYEDGVFFIPLAPLNQTEAVPKALTQALDLQDDGNTPLLDLIRMHLHAKQMLLIFDNFEHILDAAPLLNELLTAAARIKILVTSRESLFIYGERTYSVAPLSIPEPNEDVDRLLRSSAVALFVDRVQAMLPEFALNQDIAASVIQICRQLDGLPLALELAAARTRDLDLAEIAEQLSQRLALLSKGPRDMPKRQQTMRGAIDWSYQLLSPEEQHSFARLAVFENQFFAQAAIAITATNDLKSLKNMSLIQQPAEQVFSMLTIIREYAQEQLAALGEAESIRKKHAIYYRGWLDAAEPALNGRDQIAIYRRVRVELYNLQASLEWFMEQNAIEDAGRMVGILWRYWASQSLLGEGVEWFERIFAHADQLSPHVYARAAQGAGRLALLRADYDRAQALQQTSLALYQTTHDEEGQAAVLQSMGETEFVLGHYDQAETYLDESLLLFRKINLEAGIGRCLNIMGRLLVKRGDFARAEPLLYEGLNLSLAHGSSEAIGLALYELGGVLRAQGKYKEAETYYRQSLVLYQELNLAVGVGTMFYNIGFCLQAQGDHAGAYENFIAALKLLQPLDEMNALAECFIGLAGAFLYRENLDMTIKVLSAARAILDTLQGEGQVNAAEQTEYDRLYAVIQANDADWQDIWAIGQSTPLEHIIKEILRNS